MTADLTTARATMDDPYAACVRWANNAAQRLSSLVTAAEIDLRSVDRRYWLLQSIPATPKPHP